MYSSSKWGPRLRQSLIFPIFHGERSVLCFPSKCLFVAVFFFASLSANLFGEQCQYACYIDIPRLYRTILEIRNVMFSHLKSTSNHTKPSHRRGRCRQSAVSKVLLRLATTTDYGKPFVVCSRHFWVLKLMNNWTVRASADLKGCFRIQVGRW